MAFVVRPRHEGHPHGVLAPVAAGEQMPRTFGQIDQRRRRGAARAGGQQVVAAVEALRHPRHRDVVQPPRRHRARFFVRGQLARLEHQAAVIVEQFRHRVARLVADRREAVQGGDRGMHPIGNAVARMRAGAGEILAGAVLPQAVQAEQAHLRGAIARAFPAAATRQPGVIGLQRRQAARAQVVHPGRAAAHQGPVHRRLDETVVVVVAGVVDRPACPCVRLPTPLRARMVPDVPHRLLRIGRPAPLLRRVDGGAAGVQGHREIRDPGTDFQIGIACDRRTRTGRDGGFGLGHLLLHHPHGEVAVLVAAAEQEH